MKVVIYDKRELYSEHGIFYEETGTSFTLSLKEVSALTNYFQIKWRLNGLHPSPSCVPGYWEVEGWKNRYIDLLNGTLLTEQE
ncbi:hypothetical protein, partial [Xanthovirga aplysinae]|uniref:hypothetical protein n=1 Tax=Xanthovirga aplysinae TaxID=2529853 RepID=UPI0016570D37